MAKDSTRMIRFSVNPLYVIYILLAIIVAMFWLWQPWNSTTTDRFISATGEAVISAEPDKYTFSPTFQDSGSDAEAIKQRLSNDMNNIVDKLKEMGVEESKLTLSAYTYDDYYWRESADDEFVVSVNLSIEVSDKGMAQSIQDYLLTTEAQGSLTPYATFSETKQQELESQAREQAINDAKTKAEQSAKLLNAKVGKALEVIEGGGFDEYPYPLGYDIALSEDAARSSLPVLPGENEFRFTVDVKFALK